MGGNVLLLATANLLGFVSSYLEQVQQRTAFLDTKQCLEMKLVIEEQSAEQVGDILFFSGNKLNSIIGYYLKIKKKKLVISLNKKNEILIVVEY